MQILNSKSKNKLNLSALIIAIISGLANFLVTLFYAVRLNIWGDEAFSIQATKLSYTKMIELTANDVHPPLYYIFLKFWSGLFGYQEIVLRLMSMLFMFAAVMVLVLISYRYFNKKSAIITGALLSLSPFAIRIGLEIRMYSMAFLFCSLFLWTYMEHRNKPKNIFLFFMGITAALAMYTHYYSVFMIITVAIIDYINWRGSSEKLEIARFIKNSSLIKAGLVAVILYLPWLNTFLNKTKGLNGGFWVPKPMLTSPFYTPFNFLSGIDEYFLWNKPALIISLIIFLIVIFELQYFKRQVAKLDTNARFFGLIFSIPVGIMLVISLTMPTSVYYGRYLSLNAFVGFCIGLPSIIARQKGKKILILGLITLLVGNAYMLFYGNTRVLGGNWTTVFDDKKVIKCSLKNSGTNIFLVDGKGEYLTVKYYLDDVIKPKPSSYQIRYLIDNVKDLEGYDAWLDTFRYRGEFEYLLKDDAAKLNFNQNNIWYVSPSSPKFEDAESRTSLYRDFKVAQTCQTNKKLLTGYDSNKAYLIKPINQNH